MNTNTNKNTHFLQLIALGLFTGYISALLGIGGGTILVTGLYLIVRLPLKQSIGTALTVIVIYSLCGVLVHLFIRLHNFKFFYAFLITSGAVFGSATGILFLNRIANRLLTLLYVLLLCIISFHLFGFITLSISIIHLNTVLFLFIIIILGYIAGITSALFGIGGGILFVPTLTILLNCSMKEAIPTSLLCIFLTTLVGSILHFKNKNVNFSYVKYLFFSPIIGAIFGAITLHYLTPILLKYIFGCLFILCAFIMIIKNNK
ncbi:sulfite exporter TauE/SafE family protein [Chlamydiota bacterium]